MNRIFIKNVEFCTFSENKGGLKTINTKKKRVAYIGSVLVGFINGLLGAGGGMLAVPLLKKAGAEQKQAHATSIALILPLCIFSATLYLINGKVAFSDAVGYLPAGAVGAVIGAILLSKIKDNWLRKIFALFIIWSGVRMWFK